MDGSSTINYVLLYNVILLVFVVSAIFIRLANILISGIERRARLVKLDPLTSAKKRNLFRRIHDGSSAFFSPLAEPLGPNFRASGYKVVVFAIIFVVNVIFCVLPSDTNQSKGKKIILQAGLIALANLPAISLLSARNNILTWLSGIPYQHFRALHIWISCICLVLAIVHAIYFLSLKADVSEPMIRWGLVSVVIMSALVGIPSIPYIRRRFYEVFFIFHIIGFITVLVALSFHQPTQRPWIILAGLLWGFDRFVRILRLIYVHFIGPRYIHNNENKVLMPPSSPAGLVNVIARKVAGAIILDLAYPIPWKPASHVYISFLGKDQLKSNPFLFGQNHPFSVASLSNEDSFNDLTSSNEKSLEDTNIEFDSDSKEYFIDDDDDEKDEGKDKMTKNRLSRLSIKPKRKSPPNNHKRFSTFIRKSPSPLRLIARPYGGMTQWLSNEIRRQQEEKGEEEAHFKVLVEGPYGRLGGEWKGYDSLALLAAGSGISHVFGIFAHVCQRVSQNRAGLVKHIELRWVFKSLKEMMWISAPLLDVLSLAYPDDFSLKIYFHVTGNSTASLNSSLFSPFSPNAKLVTATTPAFDREELLKTPATIYRRENEEDSEDDDDSKGGGASERAGKLSESEIQTLLSDPHIKAILESPAVKLLAGRPILERELSRLVHYKSRSTGGNRVQVHLCGPSEFDKAVRSAAVTVSNVSEAFAGKGVVHVVTDTR